MVVRHSNLISNSLVVQNGSFDLESRRLEGELHKRQLVPTLQLLRLHLHVCLLNTESVARLDVGDEESELAVKIKEQNSEVLADDDPVLGEVPGEGWCSWEEGRTPSIPRVVEQLVQHVGSPRLLWKLVLLEIRWQEGGGQKFPITTFL